MTDAEHLNLLMEINRTFNPSAPVDEKDLFAGRGRQINQLLGAISQRGQHAIIYGERGVGKTSLANVITPWLEAAGQTIFAPRINAGASDSYTGLWKKMLSESQISRTKRGAGFSSVESTDTVSVVEKLPRTVAPDDVRRALTELSGAGDVLVMIIDEFDQITDAHVRKMFSDTIKTLSDHSVRATIVLVGVANTVEELILEHGSVERALVQIHLQRMAREELQEIIDKGMKRLEGVAMDPQASGYITSLSQGLPYYTHMLSVHCCRAAIDRRSWKVEMEDVRTGIARSIESARETIQNAFNEAISSPQKGNLYSDVLLACALARRDELGYFAAADVRDPVRAITGKTYDIANYVQHLNAFCDVARGAVLHKVGVKHRFRYRFTNPLMQPFVVLRGVADQRITLDELNTESLFNEKETADGGQTQNPPQRP